MRTDWSPITEWIDKLEDVTQEGSNFRAVCPKHGGHGLLFREDRNTQRVFFDCKAGCEYSEIVPKLRELGIRLWGDNQEYEYRNADGTLAFIKVTYRRRTDGKKGRFYKCLGGNGVPANHNSESKGTRGKDGKCKRCGLGAPEGIFYRLPELLSGIDAFAEVWLCEGEKDAEAILTNKGSRSLVATTTMNGVDDWNTGYRDTLANATTVVIVADNDAKLATGRNPGMTGAWKRYVALSEFTQVRVVRAAEGKDAFDHFANGHSLEDFVELSPEELAAFANPETPTESLGSSVEFRYTQSEYADRFVALYGDRFRYIAEEDLWLYYDEGRWREDRYIAQIHFAEKLCRQILDETPEFDGKKPNPNFAVAKRRCEAGQISSICRLASTRRPIVTMRSKFDQNPMLINVQNGTYDLSGRILREHRQEDMITKMCPFRYDPEATGPHFDDYFREVQPDSLWREQILRDLGYSITGNYGEYVFVHVGVGGNGKTTLLKLVTRVLGNYADAISWKALSNRAEDSHETIIADLSGKRLGIVQMGGYALSSEQLRMLVAEPDFKARKMHQDSQTIEAVHTLHVAQNNPPPMKELDASTRRRIVAIEWNVKVEDPDEALPARLLSEGDYVLTSIIDAYSRFSRTQIDQTATNAYFERNRCYAWIQQELVADPDSWLYSDELYAAYKEWCKETGERIESDTYLGRTLTGLGSARERRDLGSGRKMARSGYRFRSA